jgi:hypothetical protein
MAMNICKQAQKNFSMQSVVEYIIKKLSNMGQSKKEVDPSLFILKVTGYNDYILSPTRKLIDYQ